VEPGAPYLLADLELASRLSFFIWSSIPDDELLAAAAAGRLGDRAELERQVLRMLADPRSSALTANFAGQWLQLRNLAAAEPSSPVFPDFDEGLRQSLLRETELFFDSIIREDRSALDLLNADYTFMDERLAQHYGVPGVKGSRFRRVAVPDNRRGLLGHGSILTLTSKPNRTSPVLRGKWILENLLGTPPPPPPADVPALEEPERGAAKVLPSVRERMAQHRQNPVCASCHSMIDPLGFSLENFDAIGRWRSLDEAYKPIDASGVLPDGTKFQNVNEFRELMLKHPARFVTTLAEKLLIYALGRGVEAYDMPAVRRVTHMAAQQDFRMSAIIVGIVESVPFRMRAAARPAAGQSDSAAR
jgi:hypothetical protein